MFFDRADPDFLLRSASQCRVPHTPGFPVELGGIAELHAAFLKESRTRDHGWCRVQESGYLTRFWSDVGFHSSVLASFGPSRKTSLIAL
jgi:hypothetical protein